uniref:Lipid-binding serum glycoprotein N-terminal domain-containing protein n=1 Tax=Muntiacus muntjak TaxID=9888 RepID=A0A5N3UN69_MUNMU|nr:hypothetical protein FD754_024822 [Muntiacus muntjak]
MKVLFSLTSICLLINQRMDIEVTILNEVSQTEEKQIPCDATYVWNLKYDTKDLIQNRLVDTKSKLMGELWFLHRVRIRNVQVPDITFEATSDNSADVKIPITADVTVNLPLLGDIVDLGLKVDLQTSVSIETDAETGDSKVVVGECTNTPESISLTVLHSQASFALTCVFVINLAYRSFSYHIFKLSVCPQCRKPGFNSHELLGWAAGQPWGSK